MRNTFLFILLCFWIGILSGCRARLETSRQEEHRHAEEIGVELRRGDSLWSSIAERLRCKIEFYPIDSNSLSVLSFSDFPAVPSYTEINNAPAPWCAGAGHGAVKSIEFSMEKTEEEVKMYKTDSTYSGKTEDQDTLQKETFNETRHDNGTVATVAIVGAVALLMLFIINIYRKK